jgi:hypothetical protein
MKKFWNLNSEARALIVSTLLIVIGVGGTAFLFWFHRYDIPLGVFIGGMVVALTWLALFFVKRSNKPNIKLDIALIYIRLGIIVTLAVLFAVLQFTNVAVIASPISLIVAYGIISILTMMVYIKKGE